MKNRGGIKFITLLGLIVVLVLLIFNYQTVVDQIVVQQFRPSESVNKIMSDIQLTNKGQTTFLAAQPELNSRDTFNKHCEKKSEQTVILGCYVGPQHIYIYDVTDERLNGIREVTAAHEMLHAAYDRLSYTEQKRVNKLVEQALPEVEKTDKDLAARLKVYDKTEPGERDNELHSILGTEAPTLPQELEQYYSRYFKNRSVITQTAASYDKVFEEVKQQQDALVAQLGSLAKEIDTLTSRYNAESEQLDSDIKAFNTKADQAGAFSSSGAFYAAREELITRKDAIEDLRSNINAKVDEYNTKRSQLEAVNVKVKELNSKIDSSSVPSI